MITLVNKQVKGVLQHLTMNQNSIFTTEKIIYRDDLLSENYDKAKEEITQIAELDNKEKEEYYKPLLELLDKIYNKMLKEEKS